MCLCREPAARDRLGKEDTWPWTHVGWWDDGGVSQSDTAPLMWSWGWDGWQQMLKQLKSGMGTKINQPPHSSIYEVMWPHPSLTEIDENASLDCNRVWYWVQSKSSKGIWLWIKTRSQEKRWQQSRLLLAGQAQPCSCPAVPSRSGGGLRASDEVL